MMLAFFEQNLIILNDAVKICKFKSCTFSAFYHVEYVQNCIVISLWLSPSNKNVYEINLMHSELLHYFLFLSLSLAGRT